MSVCVKCVATCFITFGRAMPKIDESPRDRQMALSAFGFSPAKKWEKNKREKWADWFSRR